MKKKPTKKELLAIARAFYLSAPFTTKIYMVLKTGIPLSFIKRNWREISK
jgi:hypothetical protein